MATIREQFQKALHKHDGEDHINVSPFGETSSGKIAYLESKKKFYIPHMGDFLSPRNFANWAVSGGDEHQRFNANAYDMRVGDVREFRVLMLYAKYYQMASLRKSLVKDKASLDKPWTMYKKFVSGIKEYHRWEEYPGIVKEMVRHLVHDFGKKPMNFDEIIPGLTEIVNRHIRVIAGDEFVGIENIDKLVAEKREAERRVSTPPEPASLEEFESDQEDQPAEDIRLSDHQDDNAPAEDTRVTEMTAIMAEVKSSTAEAVEVI